ncbi:MAG: proton-conducting transporter membrane subunit [Candidatus Omnitrophota bacterium]
MPSLLILVPLLEIIFFNLFFGIQMTRIALWSAAALFVFQILAVLMHNYFFYNPGLDRINSFFTVHLGADRLALIMLFCIAAVCLVSLIIGRYTLTDKKQRFNFINVLIIAFIGMNGIAMTKDMFSLYVFLEITAISSFILIAFRRGRASLEGAFKYTVLSSVATIMMLTSIALLLFTSGDTSFPGLQSALANSKHNYVVIFSIAIFICGLFIKGGLMPFHGWLPDAYSSAPPAVSVLLAGIVTKVCGVYTLIRLVTGVFGFSPGLNALLLFVGLVSIITAALAALGQTDFKRMLAYSSISQVGYIILALGSGTGLGVIAAVFHLFNHSMFKSLLFVNSAAVGLQAGTTEMDDLGGLSSRMPVTSVTSIIGFLSASGIPPLSGFWSKLLIIIALWSAGQHFYALAAALASILTLAYLLIMQRKVFFGKLAPGLESVKEAGLGFSLVSIALALVTIMAGLFFPAVFVSVFEPVKQILLP